MEAHKGEVVSTVTQLLSVEVEPRSSDSQLVDFFTAPRVLLTTSSPLHHQRGFE